jgi:hypothetical protein
MRSFVTVRNQPKKPESSAPAPAVSGQITAPPIVHEVLRSPGQPLDPATRAFMEPQFGHDFGRVRVYTDSEADRSARALNARAYTVGSQVVFAAGSYAPATPDGRRLLAHELTHVQQQLGGRSNVIQRQPASGSTIDEKVTKAQDDMLAVAIWVEQQASTQTPPKKELVGVLPATQAGNLQAAVRELDALTPVLESATKEFTTAAGEVSQLHDLLAAAAKAPNASSPQGNLKGADGIARKLSQDLARVDIGKLVDASALAKGYKALAREIAKSPQTNSIADLSNTAGSLKNTFDDTSKKVADLDGARRRVLFVLRYFAALNAVKGSAAPSKAEAAAIGMLDDVTDDLELLFGSKAGLSLGFFKDLAARIGDQLKVRSDMATGLGHETELVPGQDDVRKYFQGLKKKGDPEVIQAYRDYARAFFIHREITKPADFDVKGLTEIFAPNPSLVGVRPLVCTGYALLGSSLFTEAGAKPEKFVVAMQATEAQLRSFTFDDGHALAILKREGPLVVSNDSVMADEKAAFASVSFDPALKENSGDPRFLSAEHKSSVQIATVGLVAKLQAAQRKLQAAKP